MSEEDIIKEIEDFNNITVMYGQIVFLKSQLLHFQRASKGLLDLYNKEKEKNKKLQISDESKEKSSMNYYNLYKQEEERNMKLELENIGLKEERRIAIEEIQEEYFVSKDKIREKIEEYQELVNDFEEYWSKDPRKFKREKSIDYYKLEALKELLKE